MTFVRYVTFARLLLYNPPPPPRSAFLVFLNNWAQTIEKIKIKETGDKRETAMIQMTCTQNRGKWHNYREIQL